MNTVEHINSSLYFSAVASAAGEVAKKKEKQRASSKISTFKAALKKSEEINELVASGLPTEIAGMAVDEAIVFLKDRVTMAGDALVDSLSSDAFARYRQAVSQLMKYVVKHSFELEEHKRLPDKRTHKMRVFVQIQVIDNELHTLASEILANQVDRLALLKKVEEIQGLIVDIFVS
ncbi:MAG: YaaR family protein [Treponema sp.]|nr:YaaR family protein [Treponema sp.]